MKLTTSMIAILLLLGGVLLAPDAGLARRNERSAGKPVATQGAGSARAIAVLNPTEGSQVRGTVVFTQIGAEVRVVAAITDALLRTVTSPGPVNLAFGTRVTLLHTIELLEQIIGHPLQRVHTGNRPGDVPHSQADTTLLHSLFPSLQPTPFIDGLRATVEWLRTATSA